MSLHVQTKIFFKSVPQKKKVMHIGLEWHKYTKIWMKIKVPKGGFQSDASKNNLGSTKKTFLNEPLFFLEWRTF